MPKQLSLSEAAAKLHRGEAQEIANMTGYSYSHVNHVLSGSRRDTHGQIAQAARLLVKGRRK